MRQPIVLERDVKPAKIVFDDLHLDPDLPLDRQLEDLTEDLFAAGFSNGCVLSVGWYGGYLNPNGEFGVSVNQHPDWWDPFDERSSNSIAAMKQAVLDAAEVARRRRERYPIGGREIGADHVWTNELVLDPEIPPSLQPNLHKSKLFEAYIGMRVLTIGWSTPSSPRGEFVVTLKQITEQWEFPSANLLPPSRAMDHDVPHDNPYNGT